MLSFGNERIIQQGEEWNLDIRLSQSSQEYIPFIVSSARRDPMWAITVASTKYEKNERYVVTWWLPLTDLPKFELTIPFDLGEIPTGSPVGMPEGHDPMYALYRFTRAEEAFDPVLGHKPYHYMYVQNGEKYYDYNCRIRMTVESSETSLWESQNYMYQITLVDTVSMADHIEAAKLAYPDLNWPTEDDVEVLFPFIKARIPNWFQPDIDMDAPVGHIDIPQVILTPTKLQVNNNLRRVI